MGWPEVKIHVGYTAGIFEKNHDRDSNPDSKSVGLTTLSYKGYRTSDAVSEKLIFFARTAICARSAIVEPLRAPFILI